MVTTTGTILVSMLVVELINEGRASSIFLLIASKLNVSFKEGWFASRLNIKSKALLYHTGRSSVISAILLAICGITTPRRIATSPMAII